MNIKILDHYSKRTYIEWVDGEFTGLEFTRERPGGMTTASFSIPTVYSLPYDWAKPFNAVEVYSPGKLEPVWAGFVYALERYVGDDSGIKLDMVGWVAKFGMVFAVYDLSNEKGSTWIGDHALESLADYLELGMINTGDYAIPGIREYQPFKPVREALDDILSFNYETHDWYVDNRRLHFVPLETNATYETSMEYCEGSVRADLGGGFANYVYYSYRNMAGTVTTAVAYDDETEYPPVWIGESYSDNMTAAQAQQLGESSVALHKVLGSTAELEVARVWKVGGGEIPLSEVEEGKVIRINGLIPAVAGPDQSFVNNDIDTFRIASLTYNHDTQRLNISPGKLPQKLQRKIAK